MEGCISQSPGASLGDVYGHLTGWLEGMEESSVGRYVSPGLGVLFEIWAAPNRGEAHTQGLRVVPV